MVIRGSDKEFNFKTARSRSTGGTLSNAAIAYLLNTFVQGVIDERKNALQSAYEYNEWIYKNAPYKGLVRGLRANTQNYKKNFLSDLNIVATGGIVKPELSNLWDGNGHGASFGISVSGTIIPEIRWGRSLFSRVYALYEYQLDDPHLLERKVQFF